MGHRVFTRALAASAVAALSAAGLAAAAHASVVPAKAVATVAKPYDFNGDGYADLALGSPYGKVGTKGSAGFVTIVYGSASGPNTTKKQVFSQNSSGIPGTAESGDHFGYSVTSFDYDQDGYADLLVGAPDEDTVDGTNAGTETIIWGGPSGLTGGGSAAVGEPDNYAGPNHRFGYSHAVADFDGDGWNEWVITSPGYNYFWTFTSAPPGVAATAKSFRPSAQAHRIRGLKSKLHATATGLDALIPATGDVTGDGKPDLVLGFRDSAAAAYGFDVWTDMTSDTPTAEALLHVDSLAVGDFDGDGIGDIAAGCGDESLGKGGSVSIFKGQADITASAPYTITQDTAGVPGAAVAGDRFGYSLSAGDINKDGKADLAVGVPYRTVGGKSKAGEVVVLYGSASGMGGSGAMAFSQSSSGVAGTAETGDSFGWAVGLLDTNKDGYRDVIAGTPKENGTDGAVSVLKGGAAGASGSGSVSFGAGTVGVSSRNAQLGVRVGRDG